MRSTGQTGPITTEPFTPEPEPPGTVVGSDGVTTGRLILVVVARAGREPPEGSGEDDGGSVVVALARPSDRNAEFWFPQAAPRRVTATTRAKNRSLRSGERTSPVWCSLGSRQGPGVS